MAKTVLVVDDSTSMRQMVLFTVKNAGYEAIEAVDGRDALDKLKTTPVHMVITDLNMPNLDGIGLIKEVRRNIATRFIPILMVTTESHDSKKQEGKAAGATGWIIKPFRPEQLISAVRKVLG